MDRRYFFTLLAALLLVVSCKPEVRRRPFGYMHIGRIGDFTGPESFVEKDRLFVIRDSKGIAVMSTLCTYDLSPLELKTNDSGQKIWVSRYSDSQYSLDGKVLHGPAKANLPYYYVQIDRNSYDGPRDGIYVQLGKEVEPEWRLSLE